MHKSGIPLHTYIVKLNMAPLCSNKFCLICPCQILLDGFVQINKRLLPHISLVFTRGIDHLLRAVYQGQQGALKIVLMQGTNLIREVIDEP